MTDDGVLALVRDADLSVEQQAALIRAVLHFAQRAQSAETSLAIIASEAASARRQACDTCARPA